MKTTTATTAEMKAEMVEAAERLVNEAMDAIRSGSPERAVWRLTDAAGLLGRAFGGEGYATETGRGFWLVDCRDSHAACACGAPLEFAEDKRTGTCERCRKGPEGRRS